MLVWTKVSYQETDWLLMIVRCQNQTSLDQKCLAARTQIYLTEVKEAFAIKVAADKDNR